MTDPLFAEPFPGQKLGEHVSSHGPCLSSVGGVTGRSRRCVHRERRTSSSLEVKHWRCAWCHRRMDGQCSTRGQQWAGSSSDGGRRSAGGRSALSGNARAETGHVGDAEVGLGSVHETERTKPAPCCRTINATRSDTHAEGSVQLMAAGRRGGWFASAPASASVKSRHSHHMQARPVKPWL